MLGPTSLLNVGFTDENDVCLLLRLQLQPRLLLVRLANGILQVAVFMVTMVGVVVGAITPREALVVLSAGLRLPSMNMFVQFTILMLVLLL